MRGDGGGKANSCHTAHDEAQDELGMKNEHAVVLAARVEDDSKGIPIEEAHRRHGGF